MTTYQGASVPDDSQLTDLFRQTLGYWRLLADENTAPSVALFKLDAIPTRLVPWSVVADIADGVSDVTFRFWGTERAALIGVDMTGKSLSEIEDGRMREGNLREYQEICAAAEPMLFATPIRTSTGREIHLTSLRLPLLAEDGRVSRVYSAIDPDTIGDDHYAHFGTEPRRGL